MPKTASEFPIDFIDIPGLDDMLGNLRQMQRMFWEVDRQSFEIMPDYGYALAIAGEAGEIADCFKKQLQGRHKGGTEGFREAVAEEMADVFMYLLFLPSSMEIDLAGAIRKKLDKIRQRLREQYYKRKPE